MGGSSSKPEPQSAPAPPPSYTAPAPPPSYTAPAPPSNTAPAPSSSTSNTSASHGVSSPGGVNLSNTSTVSSNASRPSQTSNYGIKSVSSQNIAKQQSFKPIPKPIVANEFINFNVNEYIIPNKSDCSIHYNNWIVDDFAIDKIAGNLRLTDFSFKVCSSYLSKKGCFSKYCHRFHVCFFWVIGKCKKEVCAHDHNFDATHNKHLLNITASDWNLKDNLRRSFFIGKDIKESEKEIICCENIFKKCNRADCKYVHSNACFLWEININNEWKPFPAYQNRNTEAYYCDANCSQIELYSNIRKTKGISKNNLYDDIFSNKFKIDFSSMQLTDSNSSFHYLRRLSTTSSILFTKSVATCWLWFWEDDYEDWIFYETPMQYDIFKICVSDYLEFKFLQNVTELELKIGSHTYAMNFSKMTQTNKSTYKCRKIRRRPLISGDQSPRWEDNTTFRSLWSVKNSDNCKLLDPVKSNSPEYRFVESMISKTQDISMMRLERVQSHYMWEAYQLRKSRMIKANSGNKIALNEQYLFHGTSESVIDKICSENFDWRLYGTNVGNIYGRGTYFSNSAAIAGGYSNVNDEGYLCMFIAVVLVGKAVVGDSTMDIPPLDEKTQRRFDTTVNNTNPTIYVKYNQDEYCPVYLLRFKRK